MKSKRFVALLIILASVVIAPQQYYGAAYFYDIAGHYAETAITSLASQGVITGRGNGYFAPGDLVTRAELVTMINRAYGFSKSANVYFSDVPANAWYHQQISYGVGAGFISGYEDNTIRPNNYVTRQEAAVMLGNVTGRRYGNGEANYFYDASSIASYAKPAVDALYAAGIIGDDDGSRYFKPAVNITRADAAVWIFRVRGSNVGYIPPVSGNPSYQPYPTYYPSYTPYPTYYPYPTYRPNGGTNVEVTSRTFGTRNGATQTVTGNLVILNKSTSVYNTRVYGDLIIDRNVGSGEVTLENVTVDGVAYINGGGTDSIEFKNCDIKSMEIYKSSGEVRVVATDKTSIGTVEVRSSAILEEDGLSRGGDGFTDVTLVSSSKTIELIGTFNTVTLDANSSYLEFNEGTIKRLNVDGKDSEVFLDTDTRITNAYIKAACIIYGRGKITKADISSNNVEAVPGIIESYASGSKRPSDYTDEYDTLLVLPNTLSPSVGTRLTTTIVPSKAQDYVDYQWQIKYPTSSYWSNIPGENSSSYLVSSSDVNCKLRVLVYGRGNYYNSTIYSFETNPVTATQSYVIDSVSLSGTPKVGNKLTATVTPAAATVTYTWEAGTSTTNMTTITGKTGSELPITDDLIGKIIRVKATGTGNYSGSTKTSDATSAVTAAQSYVIDSVSLSGTPKVGDKLTATVSPAAATVSYTWEAGTSTTNMTTITGKTGSELPITDDLIGKIIRVKVTGTGNYSGSTKESTATAAVTADLQVTITYPGSLVTGGTLLTATLTPSTATATFEWKEGTNILDTGQTYTVKAEDSGKSITVTATGTGYYTGSNPTSPAVTVN